MSKKNKNKSQKRYFREGRNVYPYAEASKALWGIGFALAIILASIFIFEVVLFLIKRLALTVQDSVGIGSELGTRLQKIITFQLPLYEVSIVLLFCFVVTAIAYAVTIALRHHEGELKPFKDDWLARRIKVNVIKNLDLDNPERDDNGNIKLSKQEQKAISILKSMQVSINTRKEVNGSDFLSIACVEFERPKNKTLRAILEKKYLNGFNAELSLASDELFAFSEPQKKNGKYLFDANVNVTEDYVYKIELAQNRLKSILNGEKVEKVAKKDVKTEKVLTKENASWDVEVLFNEKQQQQIVEQTKNANEEVENLYLALEMFINSNEKVNLQFESMRATNSNAQFTFSSPKGAKNMSFEQMKDNLENDLSKADINIVNRAGKVIIQIPLENKITADAYASFIEAFIGKKDLNPLEALVGIDTEGKPRTYNFATAPHILTAGTTGSGKSVGINMMYLSIMLHNTPDEVKFIIIDPKKTEFVPYKKSPFMYADVVTDMDGAKDAFNVLVTEMERRNSLFEKIGVRNLASYNEKVSPDKKEPYLILIADEVADLIMTNGDEVEDSMQRLGQKARSAGILVHIATQTPRADIIKGKIKANLPSKIVYKVDSGIESDIAIGQTGAERLLGRGDTYVKWSDSNNLVRVQGVFLTDENIEAIINSTIEKFPDERYYKERVKLEAFSESYVKPKELGDVSKGSIYRYSVKHLENNPVNEEEQEDAFSPKRPRREGFLEQKTLMQRPSRHSTPQIDLEKKDDGMSSVLKNLAKHNQEKRLKKLQEEEKQELQQQEQHEETPVVDTEKEPIKTGQEAEVEKEKPSQIQEREKVEEETTAKPLKIMPQEVPFNWDYRVGGYGSKSQQNVSHETKGDVD
jgi:hypothetical protein